MVFQPSLFIKISLGIVLVVMNVIINLFIQQMYSSICIIISAVVMLVVLGNNYCIYNDRLSRYFFSIKIKEIDIHEIKIVEFYSERKAGKITINIGRPEEDEYRLIFKSGEIMKIPSHYTNQRMTIGEYLCKQYKIQKKDTKKVKYLYGNP